MLKHTITTYKEINMIGGVFRQGGINCIYGASGMGKTISSIKALNQDGIIPILLDFDDNDSAEQNECQFKHVEGWDFMKAYKDPETATTIPRGEVIVIDTWHLFSDFYNEDPELLANLADGNTIIIIGHIVDIATKQDIPDIPSEFINHCHAKLFLSFDKGSSAKGKERLPGPVLEVKKLRGYKGPKLIRNWMRS